jgi:4-nitrophenyl phosphatase
LRFITFAAFMAESTFLVLEDAIGQWRSSYRRRLGKSAARPTLAALMSNAGSPANPLDLSQYRAVLLDLDGTVYHEEDALPGAVDLIRRLQREGKPYACLTNSTSSPARLAARLKRMGVDVDPRHIYTAAAAAADYVLQRFTGEEAAADVDHPPSVSLAPAPSLSPSPPARSPRVLNISTEGIEEMLDGKVHWVRNENEPCDAVIVGVPLNVYATEDRQRTALVHLRRGATLVGICADRVYPSPRGLEFGVGAFAAMFAYAAGTKPVFCGKPEAIFFRELCKRLNVSPQECVLVGDNLESDIAGAKGVGMNTILTLTGVATRADAEKAPAHLRPDGVVESLAGL